MEGFPIQWESSRVYSLEDLKREQPHPVEGVPTHDRGWNEMSFKVIPAQTILGFHGSLWSSDSVITQRLPLAHRCCLKVKQSELVSAMCWKNGLEP